MSAPVRAAVEEAVTSGLHGVLAGAAALSATAFAAAWLVRDPASLRSASAAPRRDAEPAGLRHGGEAITGQPEP